MPENLAALRQSLIGLSKNLLAGLTGVAVERAQKMLPPEKPEQPHWRDPRQPRATKADEAKLYDHNPGFCDFLPWVEYLPEPQCFLLEDNRSVGAVFELAPIATEGREPDWLMKARDSIKNALQDSFEEYEDAPWVVQFYCQDDSDFTSYMHKLRSYIKSAARGTPYTENFLALTEHHMRSISKSGGLFRDTRITKMPWRGVNRRVRLVVYRRLAGKLRLGLTPEQDLNLVCERIEGSLTHSGVGIERIDGKGFYEWLLPWFNPRPTMTGDQIPADFYQKVPYWGNGSDKGEDIELLDLPPPPFSHDFSERLLYSTPRSDVDKGFWYFDGMPHSVVVVDKLRRAPKIGHVTGEVRKGDSLNAMFDRLPEDTIMVLTMVVRPQDILEAHLARLNKKAIGDIAASRAVFV
jgi:conjugative transfer ATPase